jgi:hypothetical protein
MWAYFLSLVLGALAGFMLSHIRSAKLKTVLLVLTALMPLWFYIAMALAGGCNLGGTGGGACFGLGFVILFLLIAAPLWWIGMVFGCKRSSART